MPIIESVIGIQVIGNNGENIIKSPIVEAYIGSSLLDSTKVASDAPTDISTKVEQLMAVKHSHSNKSVLDKFAEGSDGKPTYNGTAIGGGGSTGTEFFVVNVQVQSGADEYTVTSHDKTYAQIDAAYKAGKQILAVLTISEDDTYLLPLAFVGQSDYSFGVFVGFVFTINVDDTDSWYCSIAALDADSVKAKISAGTSAESQSLQTILNYMVYPAVEKAHEHSNKSVLDLLSDANGKLQYNGSDISVTKNGVINALGYTPEAVSAQVTTGSNITLADNTEYRLTDVTTLTLTYPTGNFECWMRLTFAASGEATVILPAGTEYLGATPNFKNGETWELSFKDKVLAAQKVGGDGCSSAPVKGIDYWTEEDKQEIVADTLAALPTWTGGNY